MRSKVIITLLNSKFWLW